MKATRLAELLAGILFFAIGLYSIHATADLVGELDTARALVPGSIVYAAGVFILVDFLLGSRLLSTIGSRHRRLQVKARLWRLNVANPEALLLAVPYLAAATVALVYLLLEPLAPMPQFLAAVVTIIISGFVGGFLVLRALLDPPVSIVIAKRAPVLAGRVPWYIRLSRLSIRGRQPLLEAGRMIAEPLKLQRLEDLAQTGRTKAEVVALAGALLGLGLAALPLAGAAYILWGLAPALALFLAVPAPLAGFILLLYYKVSTRRRLLEDNMHWLSLAAALAWPLPLSHAVKVLAGGLGRLEREAEQLDASMEARGPVEGLTAYAERHPSVELRVFATSLANVLAAGGAVKEYLYDKARSLLADYRARLERLTREGLILAEVVFLVAGLGVLVTLAAALFIPSSNLVMMLAYAMPALLVLVILAGSRMPAVEYRVEGRRGVAWALLACAVALLASRGLGLEPWLGLGVVLVAGLAGYGVYYRRLAATGLGEERGLEQWLRGVMEGMRSGMPLVEALGCSSPVASEETCARVEEARRRLLAEGRFESRLAVSGLVRRVFALVQLLLDSGSATVRDVELLYRHVVEYTVALRLAREAGRVILLLSYGIPWLTAILVEVLYGLVSSYQGLASGMGLSVGSVEPVYEASRLIIVVSSLILGVMAARFYDFTYHNTLRMASVVASGVLALAAAPMLAALLF